MNTASEKVLVEGLDDWVPLGVVHWHLQHEDPSASITDVQNATIKTIRSLIDDGLFELGDLSGEGGQFVNWNMPLNESMKRLSEIYVTHYDDDRWTMSCWLNLTDKGEQLARSLQARYKGTLR